VAVCLICQRELTVVGGSGVLDCVMDRTELLLSDDCDSVVSFSSVASAGSCSVASGVSHHIFVDIKYYMLCMRRPLKLNSPAAFYFYLDRIAII
jgi:hypothetical protein